MQEQEIKAHRLERKNKALLLDGTILCVENSKELGKMNK